MPKDFKVGCKAPEITEKKIGILEHDGDEKKEEVAMIKVGRPAPDFELAGYFKGEFKQFELSEFRGKWVLLCFYPGDFTFV